MKKVLLLSLLTLVLSVFGPINNATAQIPKVISYQAEILDENGKPLNQTVAMTFAIFEQQTGGSSVWTEPQDVAVVNGFINVYLGSVTPLDLNFNKPYWLEVQVANSAFPRTRLAAVPYALNTQRAFFADSANIAGTVVDSAITQAKLAAGVQALPWGNASGDLQGTYPSPTLREGVVVENIKPGSITLDKLSPGITLPPGGPASGDLTGNYPDPLIAPGAVKTDRIFNSAVTTVKIADSSVINSKIAPDAVTTDKIMNGTILVEDLNANSFALFDKDSTNDIIVGTIAGGDLTGTYPNPTVKGIQGFPVDVPTVNGGVLTYNDSTKTYSWVLPMDSVVTSSPLTGNGTATNPVTISTQGVEDYSVLFFQEGEWTNGLVSTANIADNAITTDKLLDGSVNTTDIADSAITTNKIFSGNAPAGAVLKADGNGTTVWSNDLFTYPLDLNGDVNVNGNLAVSEILSVDGSADIVDLSATTLQVQGATTLNTADIDSAHVNYLNAVYFEADSAKANSGDFDDLVATTATFTDGAIVPDVPFGNEYAVNKTYVDGAITTATAGNTLIAAINGATDKIDAAHITLPANIALLDADNTFTGANQVTGTLIPGVGGTITATTAGTADLATIANGVAATSGSSIILAINDALTAGSINAAHLDLTSTALLAGDNTFTGTNTFSGPNMVVSSDVNFSTPNGVRFNAPSKSALLIGGDDAISINTGDVILAYGEDATDAAVTIPDNISVFQYTGNGAAVTMPTPVDGKILYVHNGGTVAALTGTPGGDLAIGDSGVYVGFGGVWVRVN